MSAKPIARVRLIHLLKVHVKQSLLYYGSVTEISGWKVISLSYPISPNYKFLSSDGSTFSNSTNSSFLRSCSR